MGGHVRIERDLIGAMTPPPEAVPVSRLVDRNPVNPRLERGLATEAADGAEDAQEYLLREIERLITVVEEIQGQLNHHPLVFGNERGEGHLVATRAPLNERALFGADFRPIPGPCVLHGYHRIQHRPRGSPKVPGARPGCYHGGAVKRILIGMALLAAMAVGAAVVYQSAARERDYRLLLARGDAASAEEQTLAAIEDYSGAVALRPDSMLAHLRRGETYAQREDLEAAARDFRMAASLDPSATRPLDLWGATLFLQQRYRRAADIFESRLRLDDRSAEVRYRLGLALYRDGNIDAALASLEEAVRLDPQMAEAFYVMGVCLREKHQTADAVAALQKAINSAPGLIAAREELADLLALLGKRNEEIAQLEMLAGLAPSRVERRVAVGLAHARAGHTDLAILTLRHALAEAPDQAAVYGALGRVWLDLAEAHGDDHPDALGKALESLERAASAASATSEVKTVYGRALLRAHQPEAAERMLQQATERYPADPSAFALYAEVAEEQHHLDAARGALVAYMALVPDDSKSAQRATKIGMLSLKLNDTDAALAWLERAVSAAPGDIAPIAGLVDAHLKAGHLDAARAALARGLQIDPTSAPLLALSRRLS